MRSAAVHDVLCNRVLVALTSFHASAGYGMGVGMAELRKITVQVPERDLKRAQKLTGEGVTETVRTALQRLAQMQAQQEARKLRGTFKFTIDLDELREDRKW
jgi:hypothetical protein